MASIRIHNWTPFLGQVIVSCFRDRKDTGHWKEVVMTKKSPWYARGSDVYHNNTRCSEENNIEKLNLITWYGRQESI